MVPELVVGSLAAAEHWRRGREEERGIAGVEDEWKGVSGWECPSQTHAFSPSSVRPERRMSKTQHLQLLGKSSSYLLGFGMPGVEVSDRCKPVSRSTLTLAAHPDCTICCRPWRAEGGRKRIASPGGERRKKRKEGRFVPTKWSRGAVNWS